ncbi:hypothetical protein KU6B_40830 [Mameliella alba]|nr:hypothetical protein KU6B_40830 [Mameliella alba]
MPQPATLSATRCTLGEGALWHPDRNSFLWFDILGHRLYEHDGQQERHWQFDRAVSAAGIVDAKRLLIASERDLFLFDLDVATESRLCDLEADNPVTRSNDGRADPLGGFWIGTMGYGGEPAPGRSIAGTRESCAGSLPRSAFPTRSVSPLMAGRPISRTRRPG